MMNPINMFIELRMKEIGIGRAELSRRLGYTNAGHGLRRVDKFLDGEIDHPHIAPRLHLALEVPREAVYEKLLESQYEADARCEAEARSLYAPHIYMGLNERRPVSRRIPFFPCPVQNRIIKLPLDFSGSPVDEQSRIVRAEIDNRNTNHGGRIPYHGLVTHYTVSRSYDELPEDRVVYAPDGCVIADATEYQKQIGERTIYIPVGASRLRPLFI